MPIVKQTIVTIVVLTLVLLCWLYLSPSAIDMLAKLNLDLDPLKKIAALKGTERQKSNTPQQAQRSAKPRRRQALVKTAAVRTAVVNDRLTAIGSGRAVQSVTITPLVSGQITELPLASGSLIKAGTVVAQLDVAVEELARDRAALTVKDLQSKLKRSEALLARRTTTAVEVENARAALSTAQVQLREAELNVTRRTVPSPIDGILGIVAANIGDYVTNQSPIVIVENRSRIVIEFYVPERFVTEVSIGAEVKASSIARPDRIFQGKVTAVDNRIDVASRTLRVRAELDNSDDKLRAGMAFQVTMRFEGETFPAVNPLAIQWDSQGSYVWQIGADGKAMRRAARIVQRNSDSVLIDAGMKEGDVVVTEGVQNVRVGVEVRVVGDDRVSPAAAGTKKESGS